MINIEMKSQKSTLYYEARAEYYDGKKVVVKKGSAISPSVNSKFKNSNRVQELRKKCIS